MEPAVKVRIIISADDGYVYSDYSAEGDDTPKRTIDAAVNGTYSALLKLAIAAHDRDRLPDGNGCNRP